MKARVFINPPNTGLRRRLGTRRLDSPWPFLLSLDPARGLVLNLPPELPEPAKTPEIHDLRPIRRRIRVTFP